LWLVVQAAGDILEVLRLVVALVPDLAPELELIVEDIITIQEDQVIREAIMELEVIAIPILATAIQEIVEEDFLIVNRTIVKEILVVAYLNLRLVTIQDSIKEVALDRWSDRILSRMQSSEQRLDIWLIRQESTLFGVQCHQWCGIIDLIIGDRITINKDPECQCAECRFNKAILNLETSTSTIILAQERSLGDVAMGKFVAVMNAARPTIMEVEITEVEIMDQVVTIETIRLGTLDLDHFLFWSSLVAAPALLFIGSAIETLTVINEPFPKLISSYLHNEWSLVFLPLNYPVTLFFKCTLSNHFDHLYTII